MGIPPCQGTELINICCIEKGRLEIIREKRVEKMHIPEKLEIDRYYKSSDDMRIFPIQIVHFTFCAFSKFGMNRNIRWLCLP